MKHAIVVLLAAASCIGCNWNLRNDQKMEAYQRWHKTRARVVCGVAAEHLKAGQVDKARASATEALSLDRDCLPAHILLSRAMLEKGMYAEAQEELAQAERLAPNNPDVAYYQGVALERREQLEPALKAYEKAQSLEPGNSAYLTAQAEVLVALGRPLEALARIEQRIKESDGDFGLLSLAGQLAMVADRPAGAAQFYQRCLDVRPNDPALREDFAKASFFAGRHEQALESLKWLAANEQYSKKAWVYVMTGDGEMALGHHAAARTAYETATQLEPGEPRTWVSLGQSAVGLGDLSRAKLACKKALTLDENCQPANLLLAYVLILEHRPEEALKLLSALPGGADPTVLCLLGRCHAALGDQEQAVACYLKALRSRPDDPLAKGLLAAAGK